MNKFLSLIFEPAVAGLATYLISFTHGFTFSNSVTIAIVIGFLFMKLGYIEVKT